LHLTDCCLFLLTPKTVHGGHGYPAPMYGGHGKHSKHSKKFKHKKMKQSKHSKKSKHHNKRKK
jgi:hypothetical protein